MDKRKKDSYSVPKCGRRLRSMPFSQDAPEFRERFIKEEIMKTKAFWLTLLTVLCFVVPSALADTVTDRCASRYGYGNQAFRDCIRRHTPPSRSDYRYYRDYRRDYRSDYDYRRGSSPSYRQDVADRCGARWGYNNQDFRDCMRRHTPPPPRRW